MRQLALLCGLTALGCGALALSLPPRRVIVAGMVLPLDDRQLFEDTVNSLETQLLGRRMYISADELTWEVTGLALGARLNREELWAYAQTRCAHGPIWVGRVRPCRLAEPPPLTVDEMTARTYLTQIGAQYWVAPRNAIRDERGRIQPERAGRLLDVDGTLALLTTALAQGETHVVALTRTIPPVVTQERIASLRVDHLLAEYVTYYDTAAEGRAANIAVAAALLDGYVLEPDETFSFNRTVGPRTVEYGFQSAEEIVNQEMVPGIGGGVCQVSSTLYNTALLSGLEITSRRPHSQPPGYVPFGRDATVYYDVIDLRFRNPYRFSIVIRAQTGAGALRVAFFGPEPLPVRYGVEVTETAAILYQEELVPVPDLAPGERTQMQTGRPGWSGKTWRVVYAASGEEVYRELISHDVYPPKSGIVHVHPAAISSTAP